MSRWICTKGCRVLNKNYSEGDIEEYATNPNSAYFEAYSGDKLLLPTHNVRKDLDNTLYFGALSWDDMTFPATRAKQGQTEKPDFDFTNIGLLFPQNDASEIMYITDQFRHRMYTGPNAVIRPHVHWIQEGADLPVWKMDYRFLENGAVVSAFTSGVAVVSEAFVYVAGELVQISLFPDLSVVGLAPSTLFDFKVYRDDNVVVGDVLLNSFDFHYMSDCLGSGREYHK